MAGYGEIADRKLGLVIDGFFKIAKLPSWKDHEERLKQHDRFPEAGIQVIMARIHVVPPAFGVCAEPIGEISGDVTKILVQVLYHFLEGADFMKELEPMRKKHPIQEPAHARRTLAPWPMIILRVQRGGIRNSPVMLGMLVQCAESARERASQPFA